MENLVNQVTLNLYRLLHTVDLSVLIVLFKHMKQNILHIPMLLNNRIIYDYPTNVLHPDRCKILELHE